MNVATTRAVACVLALCALSFAACGSPPRALRSEPGVKTVVAKVRGIT